MPNNNSFENNWIEEKKTNRMDNPLTPGKADADCGGCDLNGACAPQSKEEGGNLARTEKNIQERFCLNDESNPNSMMPTEGDDY